MKNICLLTGSRAEYGLLKPVMRAIQQHKSLHLLLLVTGMHLLSEFGNTHEEIATDGFRITEKLPIFSEVSSSLEMPFAIGEGVRKIAATFARLTPDMLLVLGDRFEVLAATIAAAYMNICIAHIHGGDSARAGLDESARHAISKFAHLHFPATDLSAERLRKMGEDPWRIRVVGAPALDTILNTQLLSKSELVSKYNVSFERTVIILVQHSVTTEPQDAGWQMIETLEAIKSISCTSIIIYPNIDNGGRRIISEINKVEDLPFIRVFKSLPQKDYLSFLKHADVLVGNSSSGIIEAPSFHLPVVNIGSRQEGRERSKNVLDVNHNREDIRRALIKALNDQCFKKTVRTCNNPYGDGKAGFRIAEHLSGINISKRWFQKKLAY